MKRISWDSSRQFVYFGDGTDSRRYTLAEAKAIHDALDLLLDDIAHRSESDHSRDVHFKRRGTTQHVYVEIGEREDELLNELLHGTMTRQGLQDNGYVRSLLKLEALGYITSYPVSGDSIGRLDVCITPEGRQYLLETEDKKRER